MQIRFFGESSGILPATDASDPTTSFDTVLDNGIATTQVVGTIPTNATSPAYITIQADGTKVWYLKLGAALTDTLDCNDAPIKLDPVNGPLGLVLTNPQKGTVICIADCGCDDGVLRSTAAWNS
jgi:hypothetical protein